MNTTSQPENDATRSCAPVAGSESWHLPDTHDPKMHRTIYAPSRTVGICKECKEWVDHAPGCSHFRPEDYVSRARRAEDREKWARERAAHWLRELQRAHGKIAQLKHDLRKLRARAQNDKLTNRPSK